MWSFSSLKVIWKFTEGLVKIPLKSERAFWQVFGFLFFSWTIVVQRLQVSTTESYKSEGIKVWKPSEHTSLQQLLTCLLLCWREVLVIWRSVCKHIPLCDITEARMNIKAAAQNCTGGHCLLVNANTCRAVGHLQCFLEVRRSCECGRMGQHIVTEVGSHDHISPDSPSSTSLSQPCSPNSHPSTDPCFFVGWADAAH